MPERIHFHRLADIVEAIEHIQQTLDGVSLDVFEADWRRRWLVERGIEIISEASRHVPEPVKSRHPHIPWRKVADIGNILRHAYDRIAGDVLWKIAQADLPELADACRRELSTDDFSS